MALVFGESNDHGRSRPCVRCLFRVRALQLNERRLQPFNLRFQLNDLRLELIPLIPILVDAFGARPIAAQVASGQLGHRQLPSTQHAVGLLLVPSFEAGLRLAPFAMHVPLACGQTPEKLWLRGLCRLCSAALRWMCSSVWTHV